MVFSRNWSNIDIFLFGYLRTPIEGYFRRKIISNKEKEIEKQLQIRLREIITERSLIDAEIEIDTEDVDKIDFYCVVFSKNEHRKNSFDRIWVIDIELKIPHNKEGFIIEKGEIRDRMKNISFPYKFYISVPNTLESKNKYYLRLLEAKCIVTGRGSVNVKDSSRWNIWFLLNNQPIHPDVQFPGSINHTLINQVLIRNSVYNTEI